MRHLLIRAMNVARRGGTRSGLRTASLPSGQSYPRPTRRPAVTAALSTEAPSRGRKHVPAAADGYTARHLTVLEGLDAVRKRPGMYIGSTDSRGLLQRLGEIFDNSVD